MSSDAARAEYSIVAVSRLTGISCHALRAWERRYGIPEPHRTASGHRRYDAEQVQLVGSIARMLEHGHAIGSVIDDLRAGRALPAEPIKAPAEPLASPVSRLVDLLIRGELPEAEALYSELDAVDRPAELAEHVLGPGLTEVGERWFRKECAIYQERLATSFLIRKLHMLLDAAQRANTRPSSRAMIGTVQGDRHEGGVLVVSVMLEAAGCRAFNLGVDLPVREYQDAIDRWRPDALAVSFVLSRNVNKRFRELSRIQGAPVFVGGRSILNYQGLARQHGLTPLPGNVSMAIAGLLSRVTRDRVEPQEDSPSRLPDEPNGREKEAGDDIDP